MKQRDYDAWEVRFSRICDLLQGNPAAQCIAMQNFSYDYVMTVSAEEAAAAAIRDLQGRIF